MNWYCPSVTVLAESPCSTIVTFVPGAKPITPESIGRDARWSRKNVPSGARRRSGVTGRAGVGLATPCCASRLGVVGRAGADVGALRWVGAGPTAGCCVGVGASQRHTTYPTITTATTPNICRRPFPTSANNSANARAKPGHREYEARMLEPDDRCRRSRRFCSGGTIAGRLTGQELIQAPRFSHKAGGADEISPIFSISQGEELKIAGAIAHPAARRRWAGRRRRS